MKITTCLIPLVLFLTTFDSPIQADVVFFSPDSVVASNTSVNPEVNLINQNGIGTSPVTLAGSSNCQNPVVVVNESNLQILKTST